MHHNKTIVPLAFLAWAGVLFSCETRGAVDAFDAATDPAYTGDGWQATDNGGAGFGAWTLASYWDAGGSPYAAAHFIDSTSTFNDLGTAFALTNSNTLNAGNFSTTATRAFAPQLNVGQTFSVDLDNPVHDPLGGISSGFVIRFLNSNSQSRLTIYNSYFYLSQQWLVYDTVADRQTGFNDVESSEGFTLDFTLTGVDSYDLTITPFAAISPIVLSGTLIDRGEFSEIAAVQFEMYGNGSGSGGNNATATGEHELFFTNLTVTSIPAPASLIAACGMGAIMAARRRRRAAPHAD